MEIQEEANRARDAAERTDQDHQEFRRRTNRAGGKRYQIGDRAGRSREAYGHGEGEIVKIGSPAFFGGVNVKGGTY